MLHTNKINLSKNTNQMNTNESTNVKKGKTIYIDSKEVGNINNNIGIVNLDVVENEVMNAATTTTTTTTTTTDADIIQRKNDNMNNNMKKYDNNMVHIKKTVNQCLEDIINKMDDNSTKNKVNIESTVVMNVDIMNCGDVKEKKQMNTKTSTNIKRGNMIYIDSKEGVDKLDSDDVKETENINFDQIIQLQMQITSLLNAMIRQEIPTQEVTPILEVTQLQQFKEIQVCQNDLVNICYIKKLKQQQQKQTDMIQFELKDFLSIYDVNGIFDKIILLNPGKYKMPDVNSIINLKDFIKEKITNAHIVAYNKIPENQKSMKGNYMKELLIELNLIEDKVILFKVKNNINIIVQENISSLKRILQDKLKKSYNNNSNSFNNKVNDIMLKEIENHFCEDITANNKYNLANISSLCNEKINQTRTKKKQLINTKKINNNNFSIISTLMFSVKLAVYSCSHRQPLPKRIHRFTKSIVTIPKDCLILYNCGLYHGHRTTDDEDIRMSFQLLSDSLSINNPFEDNASKHLCSTSCNKCSVNNFQDKIKLIDTETSLLTDKYIKNLDNGSIVMGNLDLVGWVIIKKNYSWESLKDVGKPLKKLNYLCEKKSKSRWTNENNVQKLFSNNYKGERFSKATISVSPFKFLFESDSNLVKEYLSTLIPFHNNHLRVNENLIRTHNDDAPIHVNFDVGNL